MLMQPTSPDPKFDFMLNNSAPPKRGLPLPSFSKPVKIILGVVLAVVLLIIISSALSGRNKGATQPVINTVARGQEILRVTLLAQQQFHLQDPTIQASAATVSAALASDHQQLISYLTKTGTKLSKLQLAADSDKTTDSQLQSASQNNNLDQAYITYVQQALAKYQVDLQIAYKVVGPKGKIIIKSAYDGTSTLLSTAPLKP